MVLALACVGGAVAHGQPMRVPPSQVDLDVAVENEVMATARKAAGRGDERGAHVALLARLSSQAQSAPGVALARRAAAVCGWLQNDNDHARAVRLAERVVAHLAQCTEEDDADRVERLYWEAWLEGHVLDHKARALELLQAGRKIAPDDPRLLEDALRWADALAEFGR